MGLNKNSRLHFKGGGILHPPLNPPSGRCNYTDEWDGMGIMDSQDLKVSISKSTATTHAI